MHVQRELPLCREDAAADVCQTDTLLLERLKCQTVSFEERSRSFKPDLNHSDPVVACSVCVDSATDQSPHALDSGHWRCGRARALPVIPVDSVPTVASPLRDLRGGDDDAPFALHHSPS